MTSASAARTWTVAAAWGVGGTVAVLLDAIVRLLPKALAPLREEVTPELIAAYAASMAILGYAEGYRGFQKSFAPKVVTRALALRGPLQTALAPLYCLGLLGPPAVVVRGWALLAVIVGFVGIASQLDAQWRGAVDAGVVVGLSWGAVSILARATRGAAP